MRNLLGLGIALCVFCLNINAQSSDTLTLEWDEFITLVLNHHPTARKAELIRKSGRAYLLKAKGQFDPKLFADADQKFFDEKEYFTLLEGGLSIPTWWGIDIKTKYNYNTGRFLNEQNVLPNNGLMEVGIDIPLLKGLVMNERRAQLKGAKYYDQASELKQQIMLNELLLNATMAYVKWQEKWELLGITEQTLRLALDTKSWVVNAFRKGEVAAIDTVEAHIAWQTRMQDVLASWQEVISAQMFLNSFIWNEGKDPMSLRMSVKPEDYVHESSQLSVQNFLPNKDSLLNRHPEILKSQLDVKQSELDLKLVKENLKPELRLQYNPLADVNDGVDVRFDQNNYKWAMQFNVPIFLRKGRGEVQLAKVQKEVSELDLMQKQRKLLLAVENLKQRKDILDQQIDWVTRSIGGFDQLVTAEQKKLVLGESSIFLVNLRQQKWRDTQIKGINLKYKWLQLHYQILFELGQLPEALQRQ